MSPFHSYCLNNSKVSVSFFFNNSLKKLLIFSAVSLEIAFEIPAALSFGNYFAVCWVNLLGISQCLLFFSAITSAVPSGISSVIPWKFVFQIHSNILTTFKGNFFFFGMLFSNAFENSFCNPHLNHFDNFFVIFSVMH